MQQWFWKYRVYLHNVATRKSWVNAKLQCLQRFDSVKLSAIMGERIKSQLLDLLEFFSEGKCKISFGFIWQNFNIFWSFSSSCRLMAIHEISCPDASTFCGLPFVCLRSRTFVHEKSKSLQSEYCNTSVQRFSNCILRLHRSFAVQSWLQAWWNFRLFK